MRRKRNLGDYASEAVKVDNRQRQWGYIMYDLPGKVVSVKKVAAALGQDPAKFRQRCEAYGRKVECYVSAPDTDMLERLSEKLRQKRIKHRVQEYPQRTRGQRLLIPVTYFKAPHWDE